MSKLDEFLNEDAGTIHTGASAYVQNAITKAGLADKVELKAHGNRYNDGKLKWSYVHFKSLEPMVRVLMFGAQKYEPFNWQKGLKKDEILESMQRHLAKLIDGEANDAESGLSHLGHIQCNAMFYQYMVDKELEAKKQMLSENLASTKGPDMNVRQG
jgi:hypothetical protein